MVFVAGNQSVKVSSKLVLMFKDLREYSRSRLFTQFCGNKAVDIQRVGRHEILRQRYRRHNQCN